MEHTYYRIGEVSGVTGISRDTLHFYDKIGLLVPDHIDPANQYRYYLLRNLWQLDIITTCRKLNIPLKTVKQILSLQDNGDITNLLMEYWQEAIRLSRYYQQVAEDILWYGEGNKRIEHQKDITTIQEKWLDEEVVIAGSFSRDTQSYHTILADSSSILNIGTLALRIISISFIPASFSMMFTVYFQGINQGKRSVFITVLRQIILLVPLAWLFHFAGLNYVRLTFPVTEIIAVFCCFFLYRKEMLNHRF